MKPTIAALAVGLYGMICFWIGYGLRWFEYKFTCWIEKKHNESNKSNKSDERDKSVV